jgi:hypothetical protein
MDMLVRLQIDASSTNVHGHGNQITKAKTLLIAFLWATEEETNLAKLFFLFE